MVITYQELNSEIQKKLRTAGVEQVQMESREMLCAAAEKTREELLRDLPLYASQEIIERVSALVDRRMAGEPLAYLLGEWDFLGLTLTVSPKVLIPRTDTEILAARSVEILREFGPKSRMLDLCAGSGCVGLAAVAHVRESRCVLVEEDAEGLLICRRNIRRTGLTGRATCFRGDALGSPDPAWGKFHLLSCNPPYIPSGEIATLDASVRDYEPHKALDGGEDGMKFYRAIAQNWKSILHPEGALLFEVGINQAVEVASLLVQEGYCSVMLYKDSGGILRVVEGRLPLRPQETEADAETSEQEAAAPPETEA